MRYANAQSTAEPGQLLPSAPPRAATSLGLSTTLWQFETSECAAVPLFAAAAVYADCSAVLMKRRGCAPLGVGGAAKHCRDSVENTDAQSARTAACRFESIF